MGKILFEQKERPTCVRCGVKPVKLGGITKNGFRKFQKHCSSCCKLVYVDNQSEYRKHKKLACESCDFVAEHKCQLDVDHIDGNHKNNDVSNLQTLCANCHRLKTHKQKYPLEF